MLSLRDLQDRSARALLTGDTTSIANEYSAPVGDPKRRLGIYRNNALLSLTAALKATYPVTARLADERFFNYVAHTFITGEPPRKARLSVYGGTFPRFLARFQPCRDYPIIAEMAALEWAIASSLNAAEEAAVPISELAQLRQADGKACLRLQPNLQFAISRWNLIRLWLDHRSAEGTDLRPLERRTARIAISRRGDDIQFLAMEPARFTFWRSLAKSLPIGQAMGRALARDQLFDAVAETVLLFRAGLVTGTSCSALTTN